MSRSAIPGYLARSSAIHTTPPTLLERLREPANEAAWRRLVDLYTPLLFSWARRYGVAEHDAADLVQEVFVTLVQTLPTFQYDRHRGQFRDWLRTLLLNKLRDRKRREARDEKSLAQLEPKAAGPDVATQFWEAEYPAGADPPGPAAAAGRFRAGHLEGLLGNRGPGAVPRRGGPGAGHQQNAVYIARCRVLRRLRQELSGLVE